MKARLTGWREIGPGTRHFDFEAIDWDGAFTPGQFLSLTSGEITRAYSLATPPDGKKFGLCANLVENGHFTPWIFAREVGDEIEFKGPYGVFTPRPLESESILVATGTGIAPFRSFLAGGALTGKCTLIFGTRYEAGLLYDEEWRALERSREGFSYRPTLTRPGQEWKGLTGRVQAHVFEALGDRRDIDIYICGLKEMVDQMRMELKALGVDRKRVIYEKYD
ncbi:MAG TPA: FAD-dependent oxidoreductase [Bryobacteraceae bacterium]|nr:FAD-dependent oxidoreductase [Bryobacteraceae bacterium]